MGSYIIADVAHISSVQQFSTSTETCWELDRASMTMWAAQIKPGVFFQGKGHIGGRVDLREWGNGRDRSA